MGCNMLKERLHIKVCVHTQVFVTGNVKKIMITITNLLSILIQSSFRHVMCPLPPLQQIDNSLRKQMIYCSACVLWQYNQLYHESASDINNHNTDDIVSSLVIIAMNMKHAPSQ